MTTPNDLLDFSDRARLESNARFYRYDKTLEDAADMFDADPQAWLKLPVELQDQSGMYRDFRSSYRRAVAAGVIPDDRTAETSKEQRTW